MHTYWCVYTNMHTYIYPCIVHPLQIFPELTAQITIRKYQGAHGLYFSTPCLNQDSENKTFSWGCGGSLNPASLLPYFTHQHCVLRWEPTRQPWGSAMHGLQKEEKGIQKVTWEEKKVLFGLNAHLVVGVLQRHWLKLGEAFAKPCGDWTLHIDGKWLKAFLKAADGEEAQGADILAQVQVPHLAGPQAADRQETWGAVEEGQGEAGWGAIPWQGGKKRRQKGGNGVQGEWKENQKGPPPPHEGLWAEGGSHHPQSRCPGRPFRTPSRTSGLHR